MVLSPLQAGRQQVERQRKNEIDDENEHPDEPGRTAGIRKERDKKDIYQVAKKLLELGLIPSLEAEEDEE